jgi:protein-S-isoprenylcysteine O-methyltransferase Ste14
VQSSGFFVFTVGLLLASWCMILFFNIGNGTIMPWDSTRKLVTVGPYQYVRNPMILGVLAMLVGEALFFGSAAIGILAAAFLVINHVYFIFSEEPGLETRFGESYREYKRQVPRWIPKIP